MDKLAIPNNLGNYSIAFAAMAEAVGVKPWVSNSSTPESIRLGCEAAPDSLCLSFKSSLGHFIKAAKEGVKYGVMVNSVGTCRLKYYRALQQKIINDLGYDMYIFGLGYDGIKPPLIRHFDPDNIRFFRGIKWAYKKVKVIDIIEKKAWYCRAREINKGDTTKVLKNCLDDLGNCKTGKEINAFKSSIDQSFYKIKIDKQKEVLKIALVGESAILRDRYLNHNVEDILGGLGGEVSNFFLLGDELKNIFKIGFSGKNTRKNKLKVAKPYLGSIVGGHALDSIAHTIRGHEEGFDAVVHMCPMGCMPEISVRPIIRKVSKDFNIPVLEYSFDEHTSHVGIVTRLEAFVDMLWDIKQKNRSDNK